MESEKDSLTLLVTIMEGENKYFENKVAELETQKSATSKQEEELNSQVVELEAGKNSLEIQLKEENERQLDITPF